MKKFRCMVFAFLLLFPGMAFAANTIVVTGLPCAISFTAIDSAWTWTDNYTAGRHAGGIKVDYIAFFPAAAGDTIIIRDTSATGPHLLVAPAATAALKPTKIYFNGARIRPYLDVTGGAPNAAAVLVIKLKDY